MAFTLHKGPAGGMSTMPAERFIASGAVAANMPVALAAGASGAELAKVAVVAGGSAATGYVYGVAQEAAADGAEVMVIPAMPGSVWVADAAADANVSNAAADNYLAATTLLVTVGASTNLGKKVEIIGKLGTAAERKYLVRFAPAAVLGV